MMTEKTTSSQKMFSTCRFASSCVRFGEVWSNQLGLLTAELAIVPSWTAKHVRERLRAIAVKILPRQVPRTRMYA
jgi:hypothetical protein